MPITIGRNDPCHCGSGKKYKKCHLERDEKEDQKERMKAALNAAKVAAKKDESAEDDKKNWEDDSKKKVGWFKKLTNRVTQIKGRGAQRGG